MRAKTSGLAILALALLAGCGSNNRSASLNLRQLPLIDGARVIAQARQCDVGSNAYCALQAVIVDRRFTSSGALTAGEDRLLHRLGWKSSAGDDGDEAAADSPGQRLRVTFATAMNDLIGLDEKWITRPWPIWAALDQTMFDGVPAMSLMLEEGPT
jgi:hypothetical protein